MSNEIICIFVFFICILILATSYVLFPERTKRVIFFIPALFISFLPIALFDESILWRVFLAIPMSSIFFIISFSVLFPNIVGARVKTFLSYYWNKLTEKPIAQLIGKYFGLIAGYGFKGFGLLLLSYCGFWLARYTIFTPFEQGYYWLKYGAAPERDLYWILSPSYCLDLKHFPKNYINSKDLCRVEEVFQTDWVGLQSILEYTYDLHILYITIPALFILMLLNK